VNLQKNYWILEYKKLSIIVVGIILI